MREKYRNVAWAVAEASGRYGVVALVFAAIYNMPLSSYPVETLQGVFVSVLFSMVWVVLPIGRLLVGKE